MLVAPPVPENTDPNTPHQTVIRGQTLETQLADSGFLTTLSLKDRLALLDRICTLLINAHKLKIFHGSLSPKSVLLGQLGEVLIQDWPSSTSRHREGQPSDSQRTVNALQDIAGTLTVSSAYMAPEMVRDPGRMLDGRADVYAVGAILYAFLTHKAPVSGVDLGSIRESILRHDIAPPSKIAPDQTIPLALEAVALKALSFDPANRYQTVFEFRQEMLKSIEQNSYQGDPSAPSSSWSQSAFVIGTLILVILIGLTLFFLYEASRSAQESELVIKSAREQMKRASEKEYLARLRMSQARRLEKQAKETVIKASLREAASNELIRLSKLDIEKAKQEQINALAAVKEAQRQMEGAQRQGVLAEETRAKALQTLQASELKLAQNLILQGRILARNGRWQDARDGFSRGRKYLKELGESTLSADSALWQADWRSPPPLLDVQLPLKDQQLSKLTVAVCSADGRFALCASSDSGLGSVNLDTGVLLQDWPQAHQGSILALALAPDNQRVLSAGEDQTIQLWDVRTKKNIRKLVGHTKKITSLAFDPGGILAISGGGGGELKLWNTRTGGLIHNFVGHKGTVNGVAFSPNGQRVASVDSLGQLCVWELTTSRLIQQLSESKTALQSVQFSLNNDLIMSAGGRRIQLWDWQQKKILRAFTGHRDRVLCARFSPDGRQIVSASADKSIRLWDIESGREMKRMNAHQSEVRVVGFAEKGRLIFSASLDGSLKIWDSQSARQELQILNGHSAGVSSVALSQDSQLLLSGALDNVLQLWDRATGKALTRFSEHKDSITRVALSPDGRRALSADRSGQIIMWDLIQGHALRRFPKQASLISSLEFSPDGKNILFGTQRSLIYWPVTSKSPAWTLNYAHQSFVTALAFSADGLSAFSVGGDAFVRAWNVETGRAIREKSCAPGTVHELSISPNSRRLLLGDSAHKLKLLDCKTLQSLRTLGGHQDRISATAFFPDNRHALSAAIDGEIKIWDLDSGQELDSIKTHNTAIQSLASARGGVLASGGSDTEVKVIDLSRPGRFLSFERKLNKGRMTLAKNPQDAWALLDLSRWYVFRGHWSKAQRLLDRAITAGASPPQLLIARCAWMNGLYKEARLAFMKALDNKEAAEQNILLYLKALRLEYDRAGLKPN
jgi:WD40 repeat protein